MRADSLRKLFNHIRDKCASSLATALQLVTEPDDSWELYVDLEEGLRFERDYFCIRLIDEHGNADRYAVHPEIKEIILTLPYQAVRAVSEVVNDYRDIAGLKSDLKTGPHHQFQLIVDPAVVWGWPWSYYREQMNKGKKKGKR